MKLHIVKKQSEGDTKEQVEALGKLFELVDDASQADMILCMTIYVMDDTLRLVAETRKPYAVYCWDYYSWNHGDTRVYNWPKYATMLRKASLIFVPSSAQQRRLKELTDLDSVVVHSGIKTYEFDTISDGGFLLDPVRYYPEDTSRWAVRAAEDLGIPIIHSEHQFSLDQFRVLVATCTFMTSTVNEASTGGLTLMEGRWLGKVSLINASPYMGANDYVKDAVVFHDYEGLKKKMRLLWEMRLELSPKPDWFKDYTFDTMANRIYENLRAIQK